MQTTGQPAWAALSTSGMQGLQLPKEITTVILLADGDQPGAKAALGAATKWKGEGRRVRIASAPDGLDFNDVLLERARSDDTV
jgi:DNA primase